MTKVALTSHKHFEKIKLRHAKSLADGGIDNGEKKRKIFGWASSRKVKIGEKEVLKLQSYFR